MKVGGIEEIFCSFESSMAFLVVLYLFVFSLEFKLYSTNQYFIKIINLSSVFEL